ncbi:MAG: M56 family metallopeptidase [Planctomycetota bacterium]|jgi:beta-lactamase regulating signal transducer with metallopeptidase domain/outer membrane protein assembly factor BamB
MSPFDLLYEPPWQRGTLTLFHFLWQGFAVALGLLTVVWLFRVRQARARYALSLLAMLVMAACPLVTLAVLERPQPEAGTPVLPQEANLVNHTQPSETPRPDVTVREEASPYTMQTVPNERPSARLSVTAWARSCVRFLRTHQSCLLIGWATGVFLLSARLALSVLGVHWLRRGGHSISAELAAHVDRLSRRLGVQNVPSVMASERMREAFTVGFLRPVILLPASWLGETTPEVLEAVIAHELAHIRRWDTWVNLFQRLVETLLFYHPAVWWLSRRVRVEREKCCDELAVAATHRRGAYLLALEFLARKRFAPTEPALAAAIGGGKMVLLSRIRYLVGLSPSRDRARWWPVGVLTLFVAAAVWLASTSPTQRQARAEDEAPSAVVEDQRPAAPGELLRTFRNPDPAARAGFGNGVATSGNKVIVAAPAVRSSEYTGAVYVFDGLTGRLLQTLQNPTPTVGDFFGFGLAASGSRIVVGACREDVDGIEEAGAAYLFDIETGGLLHRFRAPTPRTSDNFGWSVSFASKDVLVGAPGQNDIRKPPTSEGAAYLFDSSTGKLLRSFENPTPAARDYFGFHVAALRESVLVSAPRAPSASGDPDNLGAEHPGAVYMFDGSTGELLRTLQNPAPAGWGLFGNHLATLDNKVVVGNIGYETRTLGGAAYLFDGVSGKLLRTFHNPAPAPHDYFGRYVAALGNHVLVGARLDDAGAVNAGSVYVFDASTGELLKAIQKPDPASGEQFGVSITGFGEDILISGQGVAPGGAVYLFKGFGDPSADEAE